MDITPRHGSRTQTPPAAAPKRHLSMDGVRQRPQTPPQAPQTLPQAPAPGLPRPRAHHPNAVQPAPTVRRPQQAAKHTVAAPSKEPSVHTAQPADESEDRPTLWQRIQTPLFVIGGSIAGFGMQSLTIGLVLLAIYAVIAWFTKVHSRTSFALALVALIAVPVVIIFRQNTEVAGNFATYTFVLIVIGIVSLIRENPGTGSRYIHNRKRL
jgi:hypothetical protein